MKIKSVILFILILFLYSCSDEPNDVGESILPPTDKLKVDSILVRAFSDSMYLFRINGSQSRLLLGNYENIQAWTLLRFVGFNSIPKNDSVLSATLNLQINYKFKDTTGYFKFNVHKINNSWDDGTFTWDSVSVNNFYQYFPSASFSSTVSTEDTLEVGIESLVRQWVKDNIVSPNGIILIPDTVSTNLILGFNNESVSSAPYLKVVYRDTGSSIDTLIFIPTQSTYVANTQLPIVPDIKFIQSGVAYRHSLKFDWNQFSKIKNVSITEATLRISLDTTNCFLNSYTDRRLAAYYTTESVPPFSSLAYGTYCTYNDTQKSFNSDVRNIVQQWVTHNLNPVIVLRAISEYNSVDRFAIYSSTSPDSVRPKLEIKYTVLPR